MNIGNNRKKQQGISNIGSNTQALRSAIFSTQICTNQSPSPVISPSFALNSVKSQVSFAPQVSGAGPIKGAVDQDFSQQIQSDGRIQGTISGGYDLYPQFSLSPSRSNHESRKEYQNQISGNTNAGSSKIDSAVRGRRIGGKEPDVVCSINSLETYCNFLIIIMPIENEIQSSINSQGFDYLKNQHIKLRDRSDHSKDKINNANNFKTRKGSADSQNRQARFNSQGRSESKRGKSQSNSQTRSKNQNEYRISGVNKEINTQNRNTINGGASLRRPNSAKNLKQIPSVSSMQTMPKTLITSPTQAVLLRESSQNFLPPKPKPLRNQTMSKLPLVIYQSVGNHPIQLQNSQPSTSYSKSKRVPSASSERRTNQPSKQSQYATSSQGSSEQTTLSPLRKMNQMSISTQPTSNIKGKNASAQKNRSKSKKNKLLSSNKKFKSPVGHIYAQDSQNLQNFSPNIERIIADRIINEEQKEESWVKEPLQSFDASEIKHRGEFFNNDNNDSEPQDSQSSFLRNSNTKILKQIKSKRPLADYFKKEKNLTQEIFKSIKPQIHNVIDEDKKKKKQILNKKGPAIMPKKINVDQLKLDLAMKMNNINLAKKMKKLNTQQQDQAQQEHDIQKLKKQQSREQWQKEKEERHECLEMVKEVYKNPIKNLSSNSLTRKRDQSKSQQRPFSAKAENSSQHLLIKVPPVQIESSPIKDSRYDHKNKGLAMSVTNLSEFQQKNQEQAKQAMAELLRKAKRDKSKKKKLEDQNDIGQQKNKTNDKLFKEQCLQGFENYKKNFQNLPIKGKLRKGKNMKSQKNIQINVGASLDPSQLRKANYHRSKSKKKIDDEKENRRQSVSPGEQFGSKERKSGTKSRSDKKRRYKKHQVPEAQLQYLQQNVLELLQKQKDSKNIRNSIEGNHRQGLSKNMKSQTVADLHNIGGGFELSKNQIIISKQKLKNIYDKQGSAKSSQQQSNIDDQPTNNKEVHYNRYNQQQDFGDSQKNLLIISHQQSLQNIIDQDQHRKMFLSQQQEDLAPILQHNRYTQGYQETNSSQEQKYSQGVRPIDSLQSFKPRFQYQAPLTQSQEDLSIFRTHDNNLIDLNQVQIIRPDQINLEYQSQSSQNLQHENKFRSRSGSVEDNVNMKSIKKKRSANKQNKPTQKHDEIRSPQKAPIQSESGKQTSQGSVSKARKGSKKRLASAGFKRNQQQANTLASNGNLLIKSTNSLAQLRKSGGFIPINERPNSANAQKNNFPDYQRIIDDQNQRERVSQQLMRKIIIIQKNLKCFLAKKHVHQLRLEKIKIDRDHQYVRENFLRSSTNSNSQKTTDQINKQSLIRQIQQDPQLQFNGNINILDEESKHDVMNQSSSNQSEGFSSKMSRSANNLKHLIAQEQKIQISQRPQSSDINNKARNNVSLKSGNQISRKSSHNDQKLIDISQGQKSQQPQYLLLDKEKPDTSMKNDQQQQTLILDQDVKISRNLKDQFDSMGSLSGITKELNERRDNKSSNKPKINTKELIRQQNESKKDSFLDNIKIDNQMKNKSTSSQLHQQFSKSKVRSDENHFANSTSQVIGSEDRDMSWQFDRKSFQDFFDYNSQILKEESKRQSLEVTNNLSNQKSQFQNTVNQYETYLQDKERKHENLKQELIKLSDRKILSPTSKKRKEWLEKWVSKQEENLNQKKKLYNENVNQIMSIMDKDLQFTKQKIGSGRKSSLRFNVSHEWSQIDMSIGHLTSSSIHSTPRTQNMGGMTAPNIQDNVNLNNFSGLVNNKTERDVSRPTKLFEYQIPIKNPFNEQEQKSSQIQGNKEKESSQNRSNQYKILDNKMPTDLEEIKIQIKDTDNVFTHSLAEDLIKAKEGSKSNTHRDESNKFKESEIITTSNNDEPYPIDDEEEVESLSKQEPPQFQSPTMSPLSPNQQLTQYFSDEEEKIAPMPPFKISELENETKNQRDETEPNKSEQLNNKQNESNQENDNGYSQAFLALKEPEQPITYDQAQKLREQRDERDLQTEILTEYILNGLLEQMKSNMFPKRVLIPSIKSPSKELESMFLIDSQSPKSQKDDHQIVDEDIKEDSKDQEIVPPVRNEESQSTQIPKKKKVRGIKTNMKIVDNYIAQVFKKVKDQEDEFVENLSTPLNKDPLEILLHLQNIFADTEMENAVAFQQSVLPVDLYLDLERNKLDVCAVEPSSDTEDMEHNKSMMGEWENIHNKVIFDGINEALDNFRPYGLRGPPMPWSQQTRTLTYKNGQQIDIVLRQVRMKVMEWARTFSGALPCSELLMEYGIRGPLDEDKLNLLREERLALVLAAEIEENEMLWTDYEYEETQTKLDVADMILEFLAEEAAREMNKIQSQRQQIQTEDTTMNSSITGGQGNNQN